MTAPNPGSDEEWLLFRLEQAHDLAAFQSKVEQDRVEFSRNIEAARQKLLVEQQLREQNFWSNRESNKRDIPQRDATSATAPTKQTARVNVPVTGSDRHRDVVIAKNESTAQIQVNGGTQTPAVKSNTAHAKKTASKRMTTTTKPDPRPEKPAPTFIDLCSDDEEEADAINVCTADLPAKTGSVPTKPAQSAMRKNDDDQLPAGDQHKSTERVFSQEGSVPFPSPFLDEISTSRNVGNGVDKPPRRCPEAVSHAKDGMISPTAQSDPYSVQACSSGGNSDASHDVRLRSSIESGRLKRGGVRIDEVQMENSTAAPSTPLTLQRQQSKIVSPPSRPAKTGTTLAQLPSSSPSVHSPKPDTASSALTFKKPPLPASAATVSKHTGVDSRPRSTAKLPPSRVSITARTLNASPRPPSKRKRAVDLSSDEEELYVPSDDGEDEDSEQELSVAERMLRKFKRRPVAKKARIPDQTAPAVARLKLANKKGKNGFGFIVRAPKDLPRTAPTTSKTESKQKTESKTLKQKIPAPTATPPAKTPTKPTPHTAIPPPPPPAERHAKLQARKHTHTHLIRLVTPPSPSDKDTDLRTSLRSLSITPAPDRTTATTTAAAAAAAAPAPTTGLKADGKARHGKEHRGKGKTKRGWTEWTQSRANGDRYITKRLEQQYDD